MRSPVRRRVAVALVLGALVAFTAVAPASTAAPSEGAAQLRVPVLHWQPCGGSYQCARATVPLDYDDPGGPTISLALAKLPASDPGRRIGTLFFNPGGPGGSSTPLILGGAAPVIWTDAVLARFDVVGFDARGLGGSTAFRCFPSNEAASRFLGDTPFFPYRDDQVAPYVDTFRRYGQRCLSAAPNLIRHLTTADVARDMDLLRRAVGDDKLTYDGVSYGSFLGNVYANMFPDKVRALAVDGVLDPVAWTTGRPPRGSSLPMSMRLGSAHGADDTLGQFLARCEAAGPRRCGLAPNAATKFARLDAALKADRGSMPYDLFNAILLQEMYDTSGWDQLGEDLQGIYDETFSSAPASRAASFLQDAPRRPGWAYDNSFDIFLGVVCTDSVNPRDPSAWPRATAHQAQTAPVFAANWTWATEPCSTWPVRSDDAYLGPFDKTTSAPVLVIGNRHDPATPYHGAKTVADLLPRSRLLTLNGSGHTSWVTSSCIDRHVERYLIAGTLPPVGTVCQPDRQPFSSSAQAGSVTKSIRRSTAPIRSGSRSVQLDT